MRLSISISGAEGKGSVEAFNADGSAAGSYTTPGALWTVGTWCHVALTLSPTGAGQLYLNGGAFAAAFQLVPLPLGTRTGFLGKGPATGSPGERWFSGAISNFQVRGRRRRSLR